MRIVISNPDTIGDLVLRQPLYRALLEAGHELMLVVRPLLEPVAAMVAGGAGVRVAVAPRLLYAGGPGPGDPSLGPVAGAVRAFEPDVLLVAPFQWTALEERLALAVPGARCVAMSGRLFTDPASGPSLPSVIKPSVDVTEDVPEIHKNARLASAVLGSAVTLPDPKIEATGAQRRAAEAELSRLGLEPGSYWVACVGDRDVTQVRNWRLGRWGALLAHWARAHGRKFLFIGSQAEGETACRVRESMGDHGADVCEWYGAGEGALEVLVGMIALSRGYVGRDTGPMHLAAALGKPVLAIFGGGTWPRFLPAVDPSISITVGVPCTGCGWVCHLPESYCIKEVPLAEAISAADALERGEIKERTVRVLTPDAALLSRIGREGAVSARERLTQLSVARRRAKEAEMNTNSGEPSEGLLAEAAFGVASTVEPKTWAPVGGGAGAASAVQTELEQTRQELARARARIAQLEANAVEALNFRAKQAAQIAGARDYLTEVKARNTALEKRLEERTAELIRAQEDLRRERGALKQVETLKTELDKCRAEIAVRVREGTDYQERIRGLTRQVEEALQIGTAEHRKREAHLLEKLTETRTRLTATEGRAADLRQQIARLQGDKATLADLTRQHEQEMGLLQARVRDLCVSRWRRIGQRLHLAMELPWEREYRGNGALTR